MTEAPRRYVTNDDLENWFGYHPPSTPAITEAHEFVRREALELATMFNALLPEGAEKTLALRKIREASMWANAAIACRQEIGERPWAARAVSITVTSVEATEPPAGDLLDLAQAVISNAGLHQGGWHNLHPEWVMAAQRWRDQYHAWLDKKGLPEPKEGAPDVAAE